MKTDETSNILLEQVFDIQDPEVSISTVSSNVKISESPDGKCQVIIYGGAENAKNLAELVEISSTGKALSLRVDRRNTGLRGIFNAGSSELLVVVHVPSSTKLKVKTIAANVTVDSTVRSLNIGAISGDISILRNPAGTCNLKTVSGDISTWTFSSCQYSLKSVSGDIKVQVATGLEVDVDGKTVSGDLESEISLDPNSDSRTNGSEMVMITTSTVSGDFTLARN